MRQLMFGLFSLAAVTVAGCSTKSNETSGSNASAEAGATLPHYMIAAGPVTGNRADGINGTFRITQATAPNGSPNSGITSDRLGGTCIVFRAKDLGYTQMAAKSCTSNDDCDTGEGQPYCEASTKTCWARPIVNPPDHDPLCNRSIDYTPPMQWPVDTDVKIATNPIPVTAYNLKPDAQALTIACLRGKGAKNGCGDLNSIIKWGSPTQIP